MPVIDMPALVEQCVSKLEAARAAVPRQCIYNVLEIFINEIARNSGALITFWGPLQVEIVKALRARWSAPQVLELLAAEQHLTLRCACEFGYDIKELMLAYGDGGALQEALAANKYEALRRAAIGGNKTTLNTAALEEVIAALGGPRSPLLLEALAAKDDEAIRAACTIGNAAAVTLLSAAYGDRSDGLIAALASAPTGTVNLPIPGITTTIELRPLCLACIFGRASVVKAITAACGGPGSAKLMVVLQAGDHEAMSNAVNYSDATTLEAMVEAYGGPASPPLLAALRTSGHGLLADACRLNDNDDVFEVLIAAYGGLGSAALQEGLAADDHYALYIARQYENDAALAALAQAYGGRTSDAFKTAMQATKEERPLLWGPAPN
jgi:hypothetical protein